MVNKKIRVALLTTSFPLKKNSSSGIFVQRLVNSLPSTIKVTVVTPCSNSPVDYTSNYDLICFRYAPWKYQLLSHQPGGIPVALSQNKFARWLLPIFLTSMFLACFRAAIRADIIHANWSVNGFLAGIVGFFLRIPVVTTLRGEDVTRAQNSGVYRYLLNGCMRSSRKIIAVSEAIQSLLLSEYPDYRDKIVFLPNGINSELLNIPEKEFKSSDLRPFHMLTVGSLIPRKGIEVIVESLKYISDLKKYKLSVVGSGPSLQILKDIANKYSLNETVDFIGEIPPGQVVNHLQNADVFILASYSEGRPNVVLESFAAGVPVIASDIDGVRELMENSRNGLLFRPGDAKDLAEKIQRLKENNELQAQYSKNGREFILSNKLLWEDSGRSYAQLYAEVVSG